MSYNAQDLSGVTLALTTGGMAIGSTPSQISTATAVAYLYKGQFYSRGALATVATPTDSGSPAVVNLAAGQKCAYLVLVDPANSSAVSVVQGPIGSVGDSVAVPAVPNGRVAIGAFTMSNTTNPFILGTTSLVASGCTAAYYNFGSHPGTAL